MTDKSLKEEIEDILDRHLKCEDADDENDCDCDCVITGYNTAVYSIMEAIEKRIDEMIEKSTHAMQHDTLKYQIKEMLK